MKKILFLLMLSALSVSVLGCGKKDKEVKDNKSSSSSQEVVNDSRSSKEFENLGDKLVMGMEQGNITYSISVYFENGVAKNGVMQIRCLDEKTAVDIYSASYYDETVEEIVRDGNVVTYDFADKSFAYKGETKEKVVELLLGQGYKENK